MKQIPRIQVVNLLSVLLITAFLSLSIVFFLIVQPLQEREAELAMARNNYLEQEKEQIKDHVRNVVQLIKYSHEQFDSHVEQELSYILSVIRHHLDVEQSHELASVTELEELMPHFRNRHWQHGDLLYAIIAEDGRVLERHPDLPDLFSGAVGGFSSMDIVDAARGEEETITLIDEAEEYLGVAKWIDDLHFAILYFASRQQMAYHLQLDLFRYLADLRFGDNEEGYFFVLSRDNEPLLTSAMNPPFNDDGSPLRIPNANSRLRSRLRAVIDEQREGFLRYAYSNPANNNLVEEKLSYLAAYEPWGWIVGAGFYLADLEKGFADSEQHVLKRKHEMITLGVLLLALTLSFSLAVAIWINRHIGRLEKQRITHIHDLEQYKKLLDLSTLVSKANLKGDVTYANEAFQEVSGYSLEEMLGQPHSLFRHPSTPRSVYRQLWDRIQNGQVWRGVTMNRDKGGRDFYVQQTIMPLTDSDGQIREYIAARLDVTELLQKREQLNLAFSTDSVTALGSRFKLMQDIERMTEPACLALMDLNRFHGINKLYGHEVGDLALVHISKTLTRHFSGREISLYRLNADIFGLLAPAAGDDHEKRILEYLKLLPECPFYVDAEQTIVVPLSVTVGFACEDENLLTCADIAWKNAKKSRQEYCRYDAASDNMEEYRETLYWINAVRQALKDGRIIPYFQPIIDMTNGQTVSFETLMRMVDCDGQLVPPVKFLPILQKTHLYPYMTNAIIERACATFRHKDCRFSINLSVDDLLRKETIQLLIDTAKRYGVMKQLGIEVVETENIQNYDQAVDTLKRLRRLGCKIYIDDFGNGYSNFSYLTKFQADVIKIDGSLVRSILHDRKARELITSIIGFAHKSGMQVVAEFIDREEICEALKRLGCDFGQGYHFSEPISEFSLGECREGNAGLYRVELHAFGS